MNHRYSPSCSGTGTCGGVFPPSTPGVLPTIKPLYPYTHTCLHYLSHSLKTTVPTTPTDHPRAINLPESPSPTGTYYLLHPQNLISPNISTLHHIKPLCLPSKPYYHSSTNVNKRKTKEGMIVVTEAQQ